MIAMSQADVWSLIAIGILLVVLVFLAVAEMGLSRISKHRAQSLAESRK